jgi:DNA invertase Pin-like site-specific DNA recombinase
MASLVEMERELTAERTRAGLEVARQLGRKGGRKPRMTDSKIESAKRLLASGVPPKDVANNLGVSIGRWPIGSEAAKSDKSTLPKPNFRDASSHSSFKRAF